MGQKYIRDRQEQWDKRNLRTVSTHLTRLQALKLKVCCQRMGVTQYDLLRRYLLQVIAEHWPEEQPSPGHPAAAHAAPIGGKNAALGADQTAGNGRHALARPPLVKGSQDTTPVKGR